VIRYFGYKIFLSNAGDLAAYWRVVASAFAVYLVTGGEEDTSDTSGEVDTAE